MKFDWKMQWIFFFFDTDKRACGETDKIDMQSNIEIKFSWKWMFLNFFILRLLQFHFSRLISILNCNATQKNDILIDYFCCCYCCCWCWWCTLVKWYRLKFKSRIVIFWKWYFENFCGPLIKKKWNRRFPWKFVFEQFE